MNTGSPEYKSQGSCQRCSVNRVLQKISQNSQETTCVRDSFLLELQEKEIPAQLFSSVIAQFSRTPFHRIPPVVV